MIKKSISLVLILTLLISALTVSFAETEALVTKVVFREMTSYLNYTAIGGIRFYNNDQLIESGDKLTRTRTTGETEAFSVTSSSTYTGNHYYFPYFAVDTSVNQLGNAAEFTYWLTSGNNPETLSITFKTPQAVDKIEFVPRPDIQTERGVTGDFVIDVYYDNGNITTYDVTAIGGSQVVQTLNIEAPAASLALNITSDEDTLTPNDIIDVNVQLSGATDIFAEDITVTYDTEAFELLGEVASDTDAYSILHTDKSDGSARYIVAGKTATSGITGEEDFITLQFKAKNYVGTSDISFSSGLVADSSGNEFEPTLNSKTFTINGYTDVNATGTFTLGDLAITSSLIATTSTEWGEFTPDVNISGDVDDVDLAKIVEEMLK